MINLANPKKKVLELRVHDTDPSHVGRGIIALDRQSKEFLGVTSGDIVELEANKKTAAIIWPAKSSDEGRGVIRMDSLIRRSCGVSLGEKVKVSKAEYKEAKKVTLAPTQEVRIIASGYDRILKKSFIGRPIHRGDQVWISVFGSGFIYTVVDTNPRGIVKVTDSTQFILKEEPAKEALEGVPSITYDDIGGLDEQVRKVREMIELPMRYPELFTKLGINPPKGVLLHGPPGTGKTLLAKAVANETQAHFISVSAPSIMSKFVGEAEERVRQIFKEAEENAPSIIFFDEIDAIAPKREEVLGEVERRVVAQLLSAMDGMEARGNVIVISASVTGDTPILVKDKGIIKLTTIGEVVDQYYAAGEEGVQKDADGLEVLGMKRLLTKHDLPWTYFGGSKFQPVNGVFRHKVNEIYEIEFNGGKIKTTGNHSVFVRTKYGIKPKMVSELTLNDVLVDLPYKVNRTNSKREVRAHKFTLGKVSIKLQVYDRVVQEAYVLVKNRQLSPQQVSKTIDVHVSTAYGWQRGDWKPSSYKYYEAGMPNEVIVTPELMKLFGYYMAEGYARVELDFCFGVKENRLIEDVKHLMKRVFNLEPDSVIVVETRCNIVYNKKPLADFFANYCGKRAHNKKLPSFFFELPKDYFLHFLRAYFDGDGYAYKDGRLEVTSVSKRLITELNWLCRMHGIKSHVRQFIAKEGRTIKGGKPLRETIAYRLGMGKTSNPFNEKKKVQSQGLARIKKILKKRFDGFVYDLCGCEEEAFFGGESPVLLHNTNRVNSLDEALRRPGRFDREIEIGVPDKKGRKAVLQIHTRGMPLTPKDKLNAVDLDYFASITHGFVGADLEALAKESAMKALRRYLPKIDLEKEKIPSEFLEKMEVNKKDFLDAFKEAQPSALREVLVEIPNVNWNDVGSLEEVKEELKQAVEWPLKNPDAFKKMGITPPRGVLLYGAPGTGKTMLAKAVANESEANFISVKGPELVSKFVGETERGIRKIFKKARQVSPVIVFFDEIDSLASLRGNSFDSGVGDRAVNQLLTEIDGIEELKDVIFIAATNRPDLVDPSLLRPGRIDKLVLVPAPDEKARKEIFKIHLKNVPTEKEVDLNELAKKTEGFSGADIEGLVRETVLISLKENKMQSKPLGMKHFLEALKKIRPSISKETIEAYGEFSQHYSVFKPSYVE